MQYIALTQRCNYSCNCCPCICHDDETDLPYAKVMEQIRTLPDPYEGRVILSGGEPTIYSRFFDVMQALAQKKLKVTLLTNSSMLSKPEYIDDLSRIYPLDQMEIVTTLYNVDDRQHDKESGVDGSFFNTVQAIHLLHGKGTKVTLKHCITKNNYLQLQDFYTFVNRSFPEDVNFQLSGIDYVGMSAAEKQRMLLTAAEIKTQLDPLLESINYFRTGCGNKRIVFIVNLPLCAASWEHRHYFILHSQVGRIDYLSANINIKSRKYDCQKNSPLCEECRAYNICPGTYASAFQLMGDSYVTPYTAV